MHDLITFDYQESVVRVVTLDGALWFVATDIAAHLGYRNAPDMVRLLDDDEKGTHIVRSLGGAQEHTIISESGLYNAIFRSRRDEARAFRRWVTGTVLPELRRTGTFSATPQPLIPAAVYGSPLESADTTRFSLALSAVSLMRKLRGNAAAIILWDTLGLPRPDLLADATAEDDLAQRIMLWSGDRSGFTADELAADELAAGLGLTAPDTHLRRRIGDILRLIGFDKRRQRRGAHWLAWVWVKEAALGPAQGSEQGAGQ